jgi:histone-binding protein RBBP4
MRVWAGDEVKIDEKELEGDAMEGVESTNDTTEKARGSGSSGRGQSMSVSSGDQEET